MMEKAIYLDGVTLFSQGILSYRKQSRIESRARQAGKLLKKREKS